MLSALLLTMRLALALAPHDRVADAPLLAAVCERYATPLVSAQLLCSVAFVESKGNGRAVNAGGHCGAWQQHPMWSGMWGDDCYRDNGSRVCRQPGGLGVTCEELTDVTLAGRVAARHLHYLASNPRNRSVLCRYSGSTGERCTRYTNAVRRIENRLNGGIYD